MDTGKRPRGRLRAAWSVIRGEITTPHQIRQEWIEYQIAFDGIFDKLSTTMARIAKREQRAVKAKLEALAEDANSTEPTRHAGPETLADVKARLRRQVFTQRQGN
jgi:hypothetical protein